MRKGKWKLKVHCLIQKGKQSTVYFSQMDGNHFQLTMVKLVMKRY